MLLFKSRAFCMLLNIYLFALCPYWGIHRKMKLKKCIVGRPGYFDMVNKTQKKIKLKKIKKEQKQNKEDKTKQSK